MLGAPLPPCQWCWFIWTSAWTSGIFLSSLGNLNIWQNSRIINRWFLWFFLCFFLLLLFLLYFTLQYCIDLPYIHMNPPRGYTSSQSWIPLPPPTPYHLSGSSPCTSPKHPVSCIEHRLALHFLYDSIHVSMPFSQIIPPSPSPSESKLRSTHLCLFCCLAYRVIIAIFLNSAYMCQYTVLVFFFLAYFTLYNRLQFHPPH